MKDTASGLKHWFRSGKVQRKLVIVTFMIAPLLLLFTFTYLPFFKMFQFSFYDMKYIGKREWVGIENYIEVFTRDDIFGALKLSLYYFVASFFQLGLALYFATILSFKTRAGSFFKGAIFFPYLISGIAVGFIFKFFYTHGMVLDTILTTFGIPLDSLPYWLKDTRINNISLAATSIWRYMGQNMVLFIGAIMSVDQDMYEAAELDGANGFQKFIYIILPSIKTIIILNMILSVTGSISVFEPPYVITDGTFGTSTYFVIMHKIAHVNQKVGLASAMAVVLLAIILVVTGLQKLLFNYIFDDDASERKRQRRLKKAAKKEQEA